MKDIKNDLRKFFVSFIIWFFSLLISLFVSCFQRMTGPTYPVKSEIFIDNKVINSKLLRSHDSNSDASIRIFAEDKSIKGTVSYRRYKSYDNWTSKSLIREGEFLLFDVPKQPPGGKIMYKVFLEKNGNIYSLTDKPVIMRFKGSVPSSILFFHILFMLLGMILSTKTGFEVILKRDNAYLYALITTICIFIGGMILGPVVQKFAFGQFWTGWPYGHDLTDNKTAIIFVFWIIAILNKKERKWLLAASIGTLLVFLIPHSLFGTEIDYSKIQDNNM